MKGCGPHPGSPSGYCSPRLSLLLVWFPPAPRGPRRLLAALSASLHVERFWPLCQQHGRLKAAEQTKLIASHHAEIAVAAWRRPGRANLGPRAPAAHASKEEKESSQGFGFPKYASIEPLPAFLTALAMCLFPEAAGDWFCRARKKLLAAPHRNITSEAAFFPPHQKLTGANPTQTGHKREFPNS